MPIGDTVDFLSVFNEESYFSFGVFGYTGIPTRIGYHFPITYVSCGCSFRNIRINQL